MQQFFEFNANAQEFAPPTMEKNFFSRSIGMWRSMAIPGNRTARRRGSPWSSARMWVLPRSLSRTKAILPTPLAVGLDDLDDNSRAPEPGLGFH